MKAIVVVLSLGFAVLGLAGVGSGATAWLSWMCVTGGLLGSTVAIAIPESRRIAETYVSVAVGIVASALWIVAVALGRGSWMPRWTLAFAIGFFVVAAVGFSGRWEGTEAEA